MGWIGHDALVPRLQAVAASGGGTYLFCGPPSAGKRTVAFEVARASLCLGERGFGECACRSCAMFKAGGHPDFLCVGRSGRLKVDDMDRLVEFASTAPLLSRGKAAVVDNAADVTWEAANRMLKTLEEPPPGMLFVLVACDPSALLPTIRGRCVRVEFGALSAEDTANVLWRNMGYELPKARVLGWISANTPSDVFSQAGSFLKYRDEAKGMLCSARGGKALDLMDVVDRVDKQDRQGLGLLADMLLLVATDMLLLKSGIEKIANVDMADELRGPAGAAKAPALVGVVSALSQVKRNAHLNVGLALPLKVALVRSHQMLNA